MTQDTDKNVVLLPLREDMRSKMNFTAANEWFAELEGTPYGYHNFIYSWVDTENDNVPLILPK